MPALEAKVPTCPSCGNTEGLYDIGPPRVLEHDGKRITWQSMQCPCIRAFIVKRERPLKPRRTK